MKITRAIVLLSCMFIYILLFNSCCRNCDESISDEGGILEEEPTSTQIGFDIEGLDGINYINLKALSTTTEEKINNNGIFENPYVNNGIEDLPVLITEGEKLLFGYFPYTLKTNKVNIDDILLFYFLSYPEIAVQGVDYVSLLVDIKEGDDYDTMKSLVQQDLSQNIPPGDNDSLTNLIRKFSKDFVSGITSKVNNNSKVNEILGEFKFTYDREGKIEWLDKVALFAAIGIDIKNETTGDVVLPLNILDTKSLVLSPTSLIAWTYNEFYTDNNVPKIKSFIMSDFGTYTISFTNGNATGFGALNEQVRLRNIQYLAANFTGYVIPVGLKLFKVNPSCSNSIQLLREQVLLKASQLVLKGSAPDSGEVLAILLELSANVVGLYSDCLGNVGNGSLKLYYKLLTGEAAKKLQLAEDIATLMFLMRDFLGSNISGRETRHFSNYISFGELSVTKPYALFDIEGSPDDEFLYTKTIQEKVITYDIDRSVLPPSSTFIPKETWEGAASLPFIATVTSGNAIIKNKNIGDSSPIIRTDIDGDLDFTMVAGDENSKINVTPLFESPIVLEEHINLMVADLGKWDLSLFSYNIVTGDTSGKILTKEIDLNKSLVNNPWSESMEVSDTDRRWIINFDFNYNSISNIISCQIFMYDPQTASVTYRRDSFIHELSINNVDFNITTNAIGPNINPEVKLRGILQKKENISSDKSGISQNIYPKIDHVTQRQTSIFGTY